jgi:hypothetical protein
MEIDIIKYENECHTQMRPMSDISRKICSNILMQKNVEFINNNYNTNKLVAGIDILIYLEAVVDGFSCNFQTKSNLIELEGILMGIEIYRDWTHQIKNNEYFFFDKIEDIPFMKSYQRQKKLERILKNEL